MTDDRSAVDRVLGAIVPRAVGAIDPEAVIEKVDIDGLVDRLDVGKLVDRIDVNGLISRVDLDELLESVNLNGLMDGIDIDRLLNRIDVDGIIKRVDLDDLLTRIDVDALVARIDLDALVGRLDVNALVGRLDMNALLANVDLDVLLANVDLNALVKQAGIDDIISQAATGVFARTLDLVRRQLVGFDVVVLGSIDHLFRRGRVAESIHDGEVTGRPAGPACRTLGFVIDIGVIALLFSAMVSVTGWMVDLFTGGSVQVTARGGPGWAVAYVMWAFLYFFVSFAVAGRTVGKGLLGLRVTALDGGPIKPLQAAIRTIVFPFSFILGLGFIPALLGRDKRALHEYAGHCREIVDWGERRAAVPVPMTRWLERHGAPGAPGAPGQDGSASPPADLPVPPAVATAAAPPT